MRRADRLFELVQLLRRGNVVTGAKLARELEVSERTIYRDIQALVLAGVPVEGEAGVGYVLRGGYDLPPLMFTLEEARALALGARMVRAWADEDLTKAAQRVLDKVGSVVTPEVRAGLDDATLAVPDFHVPPGDRERLGVIRESVQLRRKLRIDYVRKDGDQNVRTVRPLGLFYWGSTWSLAAWCEMRKGFRNFRLDRMNDVRMMKIAFNEEKGKTLNDFLGSLE